MKRPFGVFFLYLCGMKKNQPLSLHDAMNQIACKKFPAEALLEMSKWVEIRKSPWSDSFYNAAVGWGHKPDGSYRISDHWNFKTRGKIHCQTTKPIDDNVWALAQFDASVGMYRILKTFEQPQTLLKDTYIFKILAFEIRYKKGVKVAKNVGTEALKKCELSFMNQFYGICEQYLVEPTQTPIFAP
jgi:hypothetical protein